MRRWVCNSSSNICSSKKSTADAKVCSRRCCRSI
jgi:hypothetical protein